MTKLYFVGGEDVAKRNSKEINGRAFTDAGGEPVVLIFSWTAKTVDRADKYRKIMIDYFEELGASKVIFAEYSDSLAEIAEKITSSDLIYLPGGDAKILVDRMKNAGVDKLIRKYDKVIVGNSAGALALCQDSILLKRLDMCPETTIISGLGLVDFSVAVHYQSSMDSELERLSEKRRIYAIPERCALVYDNGNMSFIGDVYLFYKSKKARC